MHGIIVLREILHTSGMLLRNFGTPHRCAGCGQHRYGSARRSYGGANQALLGEEDDYEDLEAAGSTSDTRLDTPATTDTEIRSPT